MAWSPNVFLGFSYTVVFGELSELCESLIGVVCDRVTIASLQDAGFRSASNQGFALRYVMSALRAWEPESLRGFGC